MQDCAILVGDVNVERRSASLRGGGKRRSPVTRLPIRFRLALQRMRRVFDLEPTTPLPDTTSQAASTRCLRSRACKRAEK